VCVCVRVCETRAAYTRLITQHQHHQARTTLVCGPPRDSGTRTSGCSAWDASSTKMCVRKRGDVEAALPPGPLSRSCSTESSPLHAQVQTMICGWVGGGG
jgi:hypothetical protein